MANSNLARRGHETIDAFMARRRQEVENFGREAEAVAHAAVKKAIRTGETLRLPTQSDVKAFGTGLLHEGRAKAVKTAKTLNRNPYVRAAVGGAAQSAGNVAGVARGAVHTGESLLNSALFAARIANPADRLTSAPGQSAVEQLYGAGEAAVGYVNRARKNPGIVADDIRKGAHQLRVDLDPTATATAPTAAGEARRMLDIGMNQGELAWNVGSAVAGAPEINALAKLGSASKAIGAAKYLEQGFSPKAAAYLAEPYEGMGHHYFPRKPWKDKFGEGAISQYFMDHPLNVSKPRGLSRGDFYEHHFAIDPNFYGAGLRRSFGGESWSGKKLGLKEHGPVGRIVFGAPDALKSTIGGVAGGAGGLGHDLQHEEDAW
jgi:hypothetical protein